MKPSLPLLSLVLLAAVGLAGCPDTGIICNSPDTRCGPGCANLASDLANCGACGQSCGSGFSCQNSKCECTPGLGLTGCGETCVNLADNSSNCGACGVVCGANELCDTVDGGASCVGSCSPGHTACVDADAGTSGCTDTTSDRQNCGACGVTCAQGSACNNGICLPTLEVTCFNSGQLYAVDAQAGLVGGMPASNPPHSPIGLAIHGTNGLVADEQSNQLFTFGNATDGSFELSAMDGIGHGATSVTVAADRAYVINSTDHTLDVIDLTQSPVTDGGSRRVCPSGTSCTASVVLLDNSYPQYVAISADAGEAYVTLQGDTTFDAGIDGGLDDPNGNRIAAINLQTLTVDTVTVIPHDITASYQPRPQGIAVVGSNVFVALANLTGYEPGADGEVDVFTPGATPGSLTVVQQDIDLGGNCVNAGAVLPIGNTLFVACGPQYSADFSSVVKPGALAGVNMTDYMLAFTAQPFACLSTDGGCQAGGALRMALAAGTLFIGDSINGRLFTADPTTGAILRGPDNALLVCPAAAGGDNFISDLAAP